MAAIDEIPLAGLATGSKTVDEIKSALAPLFWDWYAKNQDLRIASIKFWIISRKIYVRDVKDVFTLLFGPQPAAS